MSLFVVVSCHCLPFCYIIVCCCVMSLFAVVSWYCMPLCYAIASLHIQRQAFVNDLCSRLDALEHSSEDVDESWTVFRDTIHSSAMDSLGPGSRKHQDWFDENDKEIQGLLKRNTKNTRLTSEIPAQYLARLPIQTCKTVRTRLRDMQDSWLRKKADEIQSFADRKDMKKFDALKTVYGPQSSGTTPLLSADGTSLLTDKEAILKRWAEHFDGVLNRPSSINEEAINRLPQLECNPLLDELPTVSETVKAIKLLSSGKAPGSDAIPAEIYKAGDPPVAEKLTVISHYVEKRSHPSRIQGCNNYPPI